MQGLYSWLKWKTYIRWHNTWGAFYFLKGKWGSRVGLFLFLIDFIKAISYTVIYYSIFRFIILNEKILSLEDHSVTSRFIIEQLANLQNNTYFLWNIYFLLVILFCGFVGAKSSLWSLFSEDKVLLQNYSWTPQYVQTFLLIESIIWNYRPFALGILSLGISLSLAMGKSIWFVLLFTLILTLMYLWISFLFAVISYLYVLYRSYRVNRYILLIQLITLKTIALVIGYRLSVLFVPWLQQIPFFSSDFTSEQLENWIYDGYQIFGESISFLFTKLWMPNNYFAYFIYNNELFSLFILIVIGILVSMFILFLLQRYIFIDEYKYSYHYSLLPVIESVHSKLLFKLKWMKQNSIFYKLFYRSPIVFRQIGQLGGDLGFWLITGVFLGLVIDAEWGNKLVIFLLYLFVYFHTYFYCERFYSTYKGYFSLDSEGENALLYLNNEENLWFLLKKKLVVFITYAAIPILVSQIVLFLFTFNVQLLLWLVVSQGVSILVFTMILYIPTVYNAQFHYFNLEQVGEFADQKMTSSLSNLLTVGVFIPLLMLPCVLYLLDMIDLTKLVMINSSLLLVKGIAALTVINLFKRKVRKDYYFIGRYK
ncbi:hypothetical protein [Halalkalibacter krulwichiae]|uniref:Uncharacterized protein n=1 Tax=Halalkalibacter krulwichiae TaxID=199441 RepID=A0A1X9MG11_9BACI|nr:hypothetical protein [Halalkalibacter krulwichiae]ARK32388.1 hypothetical protein BkAM31D_22400 [Halalkalibacter krulwichiae]